MTPNSAQNTVANNPSATPTIITNRQITGVNATGKLNQPIKRSQKVFVDHALFPKDRSASDDSNESSTDLVHLIRNGMTEFTPQNKFNPMTDLDESDENADESSESSSDDDANVESARKTVVYSEDPSDDGSTTTKVDDDSDVVSICNLSFDWPLI